MRVRGTGGDRPRSPRATVLVAAALVVLLPSVLLACGDPATEGAGEVVVTVTVTPSATTSAPRTATPTGPTSTSPTATTSTTSTSSTTPPATSTTTRTTTTTPAPAPGPPPPATCPGDDVEVLATDDRVVALTVDLGGDDAGLTPILATLAREGVRATFFVTGSWVRSHPDGLRRIVDGGHEVGNHTDTHPDLTQLSGTRVRAEIQSAEDEVVRVSGHDPRPLFRFPFGARDERTIDIVRTQGYCAYRWTVDTLGWQGTGAGRTAATVHDRVLASLRPGEIVLMHGGANPDDGSTLDADALPSIIRDVRARGYGFTTLPTD
jgi:peptidoglycan/xylan/chitin deacetylase (PgdA/CDA1 family)